MKYRVSAYVDIYLDAEPDSNEAFEHLIRALHGLSKETAVVLVEGPVIGTILETPTRNIYQRASVPTEKAIRAW